MVDFRIASAIASGLDERFDLGFELEIEKGAVTRECRMMSRGSSHLLNV